jgi:hypothetical protein
MKEEECMTVCEIAWKDFTEATQHIQHSEGYDEDALVAATCHLEDCPACLEKWEAFRETINPPRAAERNLRDYLFPLVVKATGLPRSEVSLDTILGPLQIASLLIVLSATNRQRRVPRYFYPHKITLRKLVSLWEASEVIPLWERPALEELDLPVK